MSTEIWWAVVGLIMVIADIVFGTFFILFTGAGALVTALFIWLGIVPESATALHWIIFSGTSLLGLILFRKRLIQIFGRDSANKYNEYKGQVATVAEVIQPHGTGKVNFRGALWIARSFDGREIAQGQRVVIEKTDGIVLVVHPE